eukprot:SM000122S25751  [mRNA]  locus=s122:85161:86442:- [translate_table: standard]
MRLKLRLRVAAVLWTRAIEEATAAMALKPGGSTAGVPARILKNYLCIGVNCVTRALEIAGCSEALLTACNGGHQPDHAAALRHASEAAAARGTSPNWGLELPACGHASAREPENHQESDGEQQGGPGGARALEVAIMQQTLDTGDKALPLDVAVSMAAAPASAVDCPSVEAAAEMEGRQQGQCLKLLILAADVQPKQLTAHLPGLSAVAGVPVASINGPNRTGSALLGASLGLRTTMALAIKSGHPALDKGVEAILSHLNGMVALTP